MSGDLDSPSILPHILDYRNAPFGVILYGGTEAVLVTERIVELPLATLF